MTYQHGECPRCHAALLGDGYTSVLHCEHAHEEDYDGVEPDASPVLCRQEVEVVEHCSICKREVGEAEVGERGAWVTVCVACVAKAEGQQ